MQGAAEIPNDKLRAAFERSGLSLYEVARRAGIMKTQPDASRVGRMLGVEPNPRNGRRQQTVTYETALKLCEALGASYVEIGV